MQEQDKFIPAWATRTLVFEGGALSGLRVETRDISTRDMLALMETIEGGTHRQTIEATVQAIAGVIVDWNMCSPDGTPIDPSPDAMMALLPVHVLTELSTRWFEQLTGTIKTNSPLGSSSPSTGRSAGEAPELPMEPL